MTRVSILLAIPVGFISHIAESIPVAHSTAQFIGILGFIISLTAAWLQWDLPHRISRLEDKLKDGRLESAAMARRIRWAQMMPMFFTVIGASLLLVAVLQMFP